VVSCRPSRRRHRRRHRFHRAVAVIIDDRDFLTIIVLVLMHEFEG